MSKKSKGNLDKRLKAYTAAAAGVLVAAPAAYGAVSYSGPQNLTVSAGNPVFVDLNNDGQDDFRFWVNTGWSGPYPSGLAWLNIDSVGIGSNSAQATYGLSGTGVIHNTFHQGPANLPSCYQVQGRVPGSVIYFV